MFSRPRPRKRVGVWGALVREERLWAKFCRPVSSRNSKENFAFFSVFQFCYMQVTIA
jgi:hypothetical protein